MSKLYAVTFSVHDTENDDFERVFQIGPYYVHAASQDEAVDKAEEMVPERYEFLDVDDNSDVVVEDRTSQYYDVREGRKVAEIPRLMQARHNIVKAREALEMALPYLSNRGREFSIINDALMSADDFLAA